MRITQFIFPVTFCLAIACTITTGQAQINPITSGYGIDASASTASNCPSFCTTAGGGEFEFASGGGEFILNASATETTFGIARSNGFYDSTSTYLPTLKAYSASAAGAGADAQVTGIQGYTYDGPGTKDITIDYSLDAFVSQGTGNPDSFAIARVAAYYDDEGNFETFFGNLLFESNATILDNNTTRLESNGDVSDSISFTVNSGDNFYVIAQLSVGSERGGLADAENTFTASFADATGLAPVATAAVPEPSSAALLGLGLTALFTRRRRR